MKEMKMPEKGANSKDILDSIETFKENDLNWRGGRMFSLIYNPGAEVIEFGREAYNAYFMENGLSPFAFPSLRKMETEVIAMTAGMLNGDGRVVGSLTSGGSESIVMSVKTCRDRARAKKPGITKPNMVLPYTAHPAWVKSAHYFGLETRHVAAGEDFRADVGAMSDAADENTIMMIGSAMTYPHGVVDPIEELGELCASRDIWLHVDSCLGGFILPFVEKLGYEVPVFDFRVPGVTSMSADLHKYGFCPKGCSSVLYRNADYRQYQYFAFADFPGGVYGTSTVSGARPGGVIAAAWSVMHFLGVEGYLKLAGKSMATAEKIQKAVNDDIPGLYVLGRPHATVFAIGSDTLNVYALSDAMGERNWLLEKQHLPACLHVTVSPYHENVVDEFIADLAEAAKEIENVDASKLSEEAAMYGMMASMPDRSVAGQFAVQYLNDLYSLK